MYVCACVRVCDVRMYVCVSVCMCVRERVQAVRECDRACVCVCVCVYLCACVCLRTCVYASPHSYRATLQYSDELASLPPIFFTSSLCCHGSQRLTLKTCVRVCVHLFAYVCVRLASLLSIKREQPYSTVMSWLRCRLYFSTSSLCCHGSQRLTLKTWLRAT